MAARLPVYGFSLVLREKLWLHRWKLPRSERLRHVCRRRSTYFSSHSSEIRPSVRFGRLEITCLRVNIAKRDRRRSQRWRASSRGSSSGARSVCRLCKVIQRVMTEEQATADSGFSRYVGHSEGALFCIFLLPRLFLCCLSSHNRLSAYFFRDILLFSCFFGLLRDRGDCFDKVGNVNGRWELRMETDWEGSCVCWQPRDLYSPEISLPSNQILFC